MWDTSSLMKITCRPSCAVISKIMSTVTDSPIFQLRTQAQQDDRPSHSSQQHREGSVADKKKHPVQKFQRSQPEDSEFQIPRHGCQQTWVAFFELLVTCQSTLTYLLNPTLAAHQPPPKSQQAIDVQYTSRHKKGISLYDAFTSTSQLHQTQTIHCCFHQTIVPAIAASPNTLRIKNTNDQHCHGLNQRASGSISSQSCHSFLFFFYHYISNKSRNNRDQILLLVL
jgi:hypothetical protein